MKKINFKSSKLLNVAYPLIGVCIFLLIWFIASKIVDIELILPTPFEAITQFFLLLGDVRFWVAIGNTLLRAIISFLISTLLASIVAVIAYLVPQFAKIINPIIVIVRSVPTMSIILLAIIWLTSFSSPILITFLILFPSLYSAFKSALDNVDRQLIDMSKAFNVPIKRQITHLYLPSIAPQSLDAMRSSASFGVKITIASEVLAHTAKSIGIYMQGHSLNFDTASLLAWTIAAVALSYLIEGVFVLIKKFVVRWDNEN